MSKIAVLTGPTACGKTAVSILCAKQLGAEIICADSVQIYERLDIGSAKPTVEEMDGVVHHMMSYVPLSADYSVAQYQKEAFSCIEDILSRGKIPLVVGGTGLYIDALTKFMDFTGAVKDEAFRAHWIEIETKNPGSAHSALKEIDNESYERLHQNDIKRSIRALEIFHLTGKTISEYAAEQATKKPMYSSTIVALTMPRDELYRRIDKRVLSMIDDGLIDEVKGILDDGFDPALNSLQGLGYKEIIAYLCGEQTLDSAIESIQRGTRQFAKRQWTWFRRDDRIKWIDMSACDCAQSAADYACKSFQGNTAQNR